MGIYGETSKGNSKYTKGQRGVKAALLGEQNANNSFQDVMREKESSVR